MQFSKIFLKIIIHNQKSIVKDIRLTPPQKTVFSKSDNKKTVCTFSVHTVLCYSRYIYLSILRISSFSR